LAFKDGRISVHEEDLKRTEFGKEVLKPKPFPESRSRGWATCSEIARCEITVRIIAWGRVELELGGCGSIYVDEEDMERTELGRELLKPYYSLLFWMAWRRANAWVDSQLACLSICGLS
jgi:hypothetical protein